MTIKCPVAIATADNSCKYFLIILTLKAYKKEQIITSPE